MLLKIPVNVVLLTCILVGGCGYPNSSNVNHRIFASFTFKKSAPSSASAADDITFFMICVMVRTAPLLGGSAESADMKKCPPARLRALVSYR